MVDVFVRQNYTGAEEEKKRPLCFCAPSSSTQERSFCQDRLGTNIRKALLIKQEAGFCAADSNAMMVGFLNEFADAEEAVGNTTGATALRNEATAMSAAMTEILWDTDHFVTQVNPDPGPAGPRGISTDGMGCAKAHNCRDFVDYDSNVIAVAHGVGGKAKGAAALKRIDGGKAAGSSSPVQKCTAMQGGGPQWTSEIWYGPGDTTGFPKGNVGDSCSAMGRIAYFDALARKEVTEKQRLFFSRFSYAVPSLSWVIIVCVVFIDNENSTRLRRSFSISRLVTRQHSRRSLAACRKTCSSTPGCTSATAATARCRYVQP
jgi:hypothetical protein